ncbi:hypothetical protein AB0D40_05300 [Streptomyces massasporeus]|uniref:hypothetical protein n=1 Tax=Streptomyces massasporeus TaxID=67324 RepID=UPI00340FF6ED
MAEAADQSEQTARAAAEHADLHVLLTAPAQAATCMLHTGSRDEAVTLMTKNIPLAEKLGMGTVLTSLHTNLGACHAKADDHPAAAASFRTALQMGTDPPMSFRLLMLRQSRQRPVSISPGAFREECPSRCMVLRCHNNLVRSEAQAGSLVAPEERCSSQSSTSTRARVK